MTTVSFKQVATPDFEPTPEECREAFLDSIGGALPAPCKPEFVKLGVTHEIDGCIVDLYKIRVLSDVAAHAEHTELANLKNLLDGLTNPPADKEQLRALYQEFSLIDEQIQYRFGDHPFLTEDVEGDIDALVEKCPTEKLRAVIEDLYSKTKEFYTWTEMYVGRPADMKPGEILDLTYEAHEAGGKYDLGKGEVFGQKGNVDYKATSTSDEIDHTGPWYTKKFRCLVIAPDSQGFESRRHPIRQPLVDEVVWKKGIVDGVEQLVGVKTGEKILPSYTALQYERWKNSSGKPIIRYALMEAIQVLKTAEALGYNLSDRKIVTGKSLGGQIATFIAAYCEDVTGAVIVCGQSTQEDKLGHPEHYHSEWWSKKTEGLFKMRKTPIDLLTIFGKYDGLTTGFETLVEDTRQTFNRIAGATYQNHVEPHVHGRTPEMLKVIEDFFGEAFLKAGSRSGSCKRFVAARIGRINAGFLKTNSKKMKEIFV